MQRQGAQRASDVEDSLLRMMAWSPKPQGLGGVEVARTPYPHEPHNTYGRRLSRMGREERLVTRAIRRTLRPQKASAVEHWPDSRNWTEWR